MPEEVQIAATEMKNSDPRSAKCFSNASAQGSPGCVYGDNEVGVILMGDSHAASSISALGDAAKAQQKGALLYGLSACPTFDNIIYNSTSKHPPFKCKNFNEWAFARLAEHPNIPLILISRTSTYLLGPNELEHIKEPQGTTVNFGTKYDSRSNPKYIQEFQSALISTACRLAQERIVYLMRPFPEYTTSVPHDLVRNIYLAKSTEDIRITLAEYHKRNKYVWAAQDQAAKQCGVKLLDPLPYLCDDQYCYGSRNGRPLYKDDNHLSEYGNKYLIPMFEQIFKDSSIVSAP